MTDEEMLRAAIEPVLNGIVALKGEIQAMRLALTSTTITADEIEAIRADVQRVELQYADIELRLAHLERRLEELHSVCPGMAMGPAAAVTP